MDKGLFVSVLMALTLSACSSSPRLNGKNLPKFTYLDGLRTEKTVNCGSRTPYECMACALQGEAANQPGPGIYAVAMTIMTRAQANPAQICSVTKARNQFEGMKKYGNRKISTKVWTVTEHIMESRETGWTHFWAPRTQAKLKRNPPSWARTYEKRRCEQEKIGQHIFINKNKCDRSSRLPASPSSQ